MAAARGKKERGKAKQNRQVSTKRKKNSPRKGEEID